MRTHADLADEILGEVEYELPVLLADASGRVDDKDDVGDRTFRGGDFSQHLNTKS